MRTLEESNLRTDVVVAGGGVIGLSVARELARSGLKATIVERGRVGREASHAAGGMLAPQSEADGEDAFFRLQCASRDLYPSFAEELFEETGLSIELDRTGTLYLGFNEEDAAELERRYRWQSRAKLTIERLTSGEVRALEPRVSPHVLLGLRFARDWQVENRRLVAALAASVEKQNVRILTGTEATGVRLEGDRVRGLETSRGLVEADAVVLAAGAWTSLLPCTTRPHGAPSALPLRALPGHPPIEPVRGQMLCLEAHPPLCAHVIYSPRGYLVPRRDGRLLAGSTTERAGFEKLLTLEGVRAMAQHALEIAPAIAQLPIVDAWAGLRPCADDEWPVLGASTEARGLFYATGHYRNGILLAPLTARLIADLVTGRDARPSEALAPFSPARFRPTARAADARSD